MSLGPWRRNPKLVPSPSQRHCSDRIEGSTCLTQFAAKRPELSERRCDTTLQRRARQQRVPAAICPPARVTRFDPGTRWFRNGGRSAFRIGSRQGLQWGLAARPCASTVQAEECDHFSHRLQTGALLESMCSPRRKRPHEGVTRTLPNPTTRSCQRGRLSSQASSPRFPLPRRRRGPKAST